MARSATENKEVGFLELLRGNVHFRRLWAGNIVSLLGDWFNFIALVSLIDRETGSPLAVGFVFIAKMLPFALASPFAGVLVDRLNRRRLMIGTDLIRAVIVLGLVLVSGPETAYLAYILTAAQMIVGSAFVPARSASIPNVTEKHELLTANALMSASWSIMLALGAGIGGFLTSWVGPHAVFVIDSLTYLLSAWFIWRAKIPQETETDPDPFWETALHKITDGWRMMRARPRIGRIALAKASWAVAGGGLVFMLTLVGEEIVLSPTMQAAGIGMLFLARGVGTGIGPVAARAFFKDQRVWPLLLGIFVVVSGLFYGTLGMVPWSWWIVLLVVGAHASSGAQWVLVTVMLQQRTEDAFRGRVFATEWLLVMLAETISIFVGAWLLETGTISLRTGFQLFALAQIVCGLLFTLLIVPAERLDDGRPTTDDG